MESPPAAGTLPSACRPHLRGQTPASLAALWPGLDPSVARRVVNRLVFEDRDDLEAVRGLSQTLARELLARGQLTRLSVLDRRQSRLDRFVKYLFRSPDGRVFETVRIPLERPRFSVCVSSQAGCALGCAFCETGRLGLLRSLEAWEIVEQVLRVRRESSERPVTGVVFQGQGEPFQNYDNVVRAAEIFRDPSGVRIRGDRISISTVGIPALIRRYTEERHPYRLILSLTSAFSEKRARLVPLGRKHEVGELVAAMRFHARARGGPVNLAWVLISGFNTGPEEASELGRLFAGVPVRLSLIDVNDPTGGFPKAGEEERGRFLDALTSQGLAFVRRYSGGAEIKGACGMLASSAQGGDVLPPPPEEARVCGPGVGQGPGA